MELLALCMACTNAQGTAAARIVVITCAYLVTHSEIPIYLICQM